MIASYPKVWALGHRAVEGMMDTPVIVQEKLDGSQISFGVYNTTSGERQLIVKSKGKQQFPGDTDKLFQPAVEIIENLHLEGWLRLGWTYRGEYLASEKHNTLKYNRIPNGHIALFDVQDERGQFLMRDEVVGEAEMLALDCVPTLWGPHILKSFDGLGEYLAQESFLGGPKMEGVVIKNYNKLSAFGDPCFAKFVSEAFKEQHRGDWKNRNPNGAEFVELLGSEFCVEPRFRKAVQHLAERGELKGDPSDIGPLMKELSWDFVTENVDEIKDRLWEHYRKKIIGAANKGFPEWYKTQLAEQAWKDAA